MAKRLFELLAVEQQLKAQAQATRGDLRNTFEKKRHLFEEKRKTFVPSDEGAQPVTEEQSDIQSTVEKELAWLAGLWTKALDTSYQVAEGNTIARADLTLDDGTILLTGVPATALLELEKRAAEIRELLLAVPTLDPAKGFEADPGKGAGVFRAREVRKVRTRKVQKPLVLYPATPEHPAQTQVVSFDEPAGHVTEHEWSGLITPARKAELLARAETLQRACKAALHRANAVELPSTLGACGEKLFGYVFGNGKK